MAKVFTITEGLENMGAMKTGGQGSVYKGRRFGEIITAIKILPTPIYSESADDKNFIAFQNEVQKLKKVNETPNANVVKILSSGITDSGNFPFIEMEYIEGPDLEELLKPPHDPVFSIKEVLKVADQLSYALAHCHKIDVRHGDIKSNNVKYNVNTANYVLLDFGLAVMSDEQRRTSLRLAGAIEFMAPEQSEGQMLFQTDIYSFGVVLFELLAGTVPFPLKDKGESARNTVVVAHLETPPPDVLPLRANALPQTWTGEKKEREMQVPDWLTTMIYKCLQKKPEDRFSNGMELHDFIWHNSIRTSNSNELTDIRISLLEQENKKLIQDKEYLQQQLLKYEKPARITDAGSQKSVFPAHDATAVKSDNVKRSFPKKILLALISFILLAAIVIALAKYSGASTSSAKEVIAEYKVIASRAYFHNEADAGTRRNAFAVLNNETIKVYDDKNGFVYTEITNEKNQTSKGWLRKQDLMTIQEWQKYNRTPAVSASQPKEITNQLQNAKQFLATGKTVEALIIYNILANQEVPEAQYQYARLSLQNKNDNLTCIEAFDLLKKASDKGFTPAKRTLGFLYSYADNKAVLQQANYYDRCNFAKNLSFGSQLLMEAALAGDTAASSLLDQLNIK